MRKVFGGLAMAAFVAILFVMLHYRDSFTHRVSPVPNGTTGAGVVFFDRWRADDGYNVVNEYFHHPSCQVIDMDGREVYRFPNAFCAFLKDGSVVFLNLGGNLVSFDRDAHQRWSVHREFHHDFDVSEERGEVFTVTQKTHRYQGKELDTHLIEGFSLADGAPIFTWNSTEHLAELDALFGEHTHFDLSASGGEFLHLNSVQVLPPNDLEKTDPAFQRGNILVNCFQTRRLFILNRQTRKIVWHHELHTIVGDARGLDDKGAHTVKMLASGHLFYMVNESGYGGSPVFSSLVELDPVTHKSVWHYVADPAPQFHSKIWGSAYQLPDGHALVTNTMAGSAFEITRDGRIVWEWLNPVPDPLGLPGPIYRVTRVPKALVDPIVARWKDVL